MENWFAAVTLGTIAALVNPLVAEWVKYYYPIKGLLL